MNTPIVYRIGIGNKKDVVEVINKGKSCIINSNSSGIHKCILNPFGLPVDLIVKDLFEREFIMNGSNVTLERVSLA